MTTTPQNISSETIFSMFTTAVEGLGESAFGIMIKDKQKLFVILKNNQNDFEFEEDLNDEFDDEPYICSGTTRSKVNGFPLMRVCHAKEYVLWFRGGTVQNLCDLINLNEKLLSKGCECSINVLTKNCGCT